MLPQTTFRSLSNISVATMVTLQAHMFAVLKKGIILNFIMNLELTGQLTSLHTHY
jgi:hypothetical protein